MKLNNIPRNKVNQRGKRCTLKTINTLMRETEDDSNKWKDILCSWIGNLILLTCPYYSKHSTDSLQFLPKFQWKFSQIQTNNRKVCMEPQKTLNTKAILRKSNKAGSVILPVFKLY